MFASGTLLFLSESIKCLYNFAFWVKMVPLTAPGRAQPRQRALQPVALRPPIAIDQGVSKRIVAVACHQRTGAAWAKRLFASLRQVFCARE
jgi:hypothetical protein